MSEQELQKYVDLARQGKASGQRQLYQQLYGYGMSVCVRYGQNEAEAEEILNDGFLKAFKNLDKYAPTMPFRAWFRRILINTAIDYHRKYQKYRYTADLEQGQHAIADAADALSSLSATEILGLVQELAPSYRTVFNLYVVEGYKHKEIGEQLNITEATSRATFAVARQKLQQKILATQNINQNSSNG
jgi:RNA polymerase sigma-70 factor, ECF subfamily